MKVKVTMGDWSNDGHGMTQVDIVELPTVMDESELAEMYVLGRNVIGFDMTEQVARGYDQGYIEEEDYNRLLELGYEPYKFKKVAGMWDERPEKGDERIWITAEIYLDFYMFFIATGYKKKIGTNDSFGYYIVSDDMPSVRIGGYGLFVN